jgi:hypothetical protein
VDMPPDEPKEVDEHLAEAVEHAVAEGWSFPKIASHVMSVFEDVTPGEKG